MGDLDIFWVSSYYNYIMYVYIFIREGINFNFKMQNFSGYLEILQFP